MPTARGANTRLLAKEESVYGTNPGGSDWVQYPFNPPLSFGATQELTQSPTIGISTNRDPGEPFRENVTVPLSAGIPIDLTHIGFWLHKLFGDAATTGSSDYTHVFKSGTFTALPSISLEVGLPDLPRYFLYTGVKANTLSITAAPGGKPAASVGLIGQDEVESGTSVDGSPTVASSLVTFNNYQATLSREATPLSYVTGFAVNFTNNIESIRDIGSGQNIREALESDTGISGTLTERLAATTLLADAVASTYKSFTILWSIGATQQLQIDIPRVHLQRVQKTIQGKAGIEIGWSWQAEYDTSAAAAMVVTLKNQTASY